MARVKGTCPAPTGDLLRPTLIPDRRCSSLKKTRPSIAESLVLHYLHFPLCAEQQNARRLLVATGLVGAYRPIEQLVRVEIDLEEGRTILNVPGDQRLRKRIFDVPLQRAAQRTCAVAAVDQRLVENPLLRIVVH